MTEPTEQELRFRHVINRISEYGVEEFARKMQLAATAWENARGARCTNWWVGPDRYDPDNVVQVSFDFDDHRSRTYRVCFTVPRKANVFGKELTVLGYSFTPELYFPDQERKHRELVEAA